jgi:pimeloyl-ACP methyl ester carboxylesterase
LSDVSQTLRRPSTWGAIPLVGIVAWVLSTNWDPVANSHPSYLILYLTALVLGLGVTIRGFIAGKPTGRLWVSSVGAVGLLVLALGALWLSPFAAEPVALDALNDPGSMAVTETSTEIVMEPRSEEATTGIVFHPGARVDARAYANVLRPLAEAGNHVVIVKEPLGIAFLSLGFTASWIEQHPQIDRWIVGGHSLGGVVAAGDAESLGTAGLLLWASFPASDISDSTALEVTSVYGTADAIATPEDVLASAPELPGAAVFVPIEGGIHSFFGDYGLQPGDGSPGTDRIAAQSQIASASLDLVAAIEGGGPDE